MLSGLDLCFLDEEEEADEDQAPEPVMAKELLGLEPALEEAPVSATTNIMPSSIPLPLAKDLTDQLKLLQVLPLIPKLRSQTPNLISIFFCFLSM